MNTETAKVLVEVAGAFKEVSGLDTNYPDKWPPDKICSASFLIRILPSVFWNNDHGEKEFIRRKLRGFYAKATEGDLSTAASVLREVLVNELGGGEHRDDLAAYAFLSELCDAGEDISESILKHVRKGGHTTRSRRRT